MINRRKFLQFAAAVPFIGPLLKAGCKAKCEAVQPISLDQFVAEGGPNTPAVVGIANDYRDWRNHYVGVDPAAGPDKSVLIIGGNGKVFMFKDQGWRRVK